MTSTVAGPLVPSPPEGTTPEAWDWQAFDETLRPRLIRAGRRFGFAVDEAEDVVQDVLETVFAKRPRARNPEAYVVAMFQNRCRDRLEARRLRRQREVPLVDGTASDDRAPRQIHAACAVAGAYRLVGTGCRSLIEAYCVDRKTLAEVAAEVGCSVNAVWKRVNQCLKRMLLCLSR